MRVPFLLACFTSAALAASAPAQGFTPEEAVKRMKLPDGFSVRCVASEPMIRQPLSISFDSRGRLWVLQYLQYPNPAGLKPVKQDQYLRTQWDKIPDPPPKGAKGLDKITICYDPDENGIFRKSKDFATGLNLASGFCLGNGGVYVVQPPYLLFYPDKNEDDVPDGDPEVLLSGFGLDDTHSLANSLQWGPDGWLYGAAGSTSTCKIKDPSGKAKEPIEFQQGLWRYHPKTKQFELFSEGGGNTYGLDFDRHGNAISGTNWGGFAMLHQMQGAYYVKGFSKHGPLHNPHAYGYFDHVPYKNFKGGHVTCGGILYEADVYPKEFRHQYIAGNLLSNAVYWHKLTPKGASFTAEHGGELLEANDTWFRPVDLQLGPDGCVYVADWYDKRAAHLDPIDNWDKTNGRVYKIEYKGAKKLEPFDLRKKTTAELVELLKHPNVWWRREARQELGGRADFPKFIDALRQPTFDDAPHSLDSFWLVFSQRRMTDGLHLGAALRSKRPEVRGWAVRFFGEDPSYLGQGYETVLAELAGGGERDPAVLAEIACAARRVKPEHALPILIALADHPQLRTEPWLVHLTWWGMDAHFDALAGKFLRAVSGAREPAAPLYERLVRRLLTHRTLAQDAERQVGDLTGPFHRHPWAAVAGMEAALDDGSQAREVVRLIAAKLKPDTAERAESVRRVLAKAGDPATHTALRAIIADDTKPDAERVRAIGLAVRLPSPELHTQLSKLFTSSKSDAVRLAVVGGLESTGATDPLTDLLGQYAGQATAVKKRLVQALLTNPKSSLALFARLDAGTFPKADVSVEQAKTAVALNDKDLTKLVEKQFGKLASTAGEKRARIDALNMMLNREKPGDPAKGQVLYTKHCGACHQLFGEGAKVGPDLTSADRKNRYTLLTNIVDPSGYIRPEFVTHTVNTLDGRTLSGVVTEQSPEKITLATYANSKVETAVIARRDIDKIDPSALSLMPEKLLDTMSETEIRDLLAYVSLEKPLTPQPPLPRPGEGEKKANPDRKGGGDPKKLKVALVSGSLEYKSDDTLPVLQKLLEDKYPVECVRMFRKTDTDIPGLDKLKECDLAVFYTRRLKIDGDQLKAVKAFCESGKPVIGLRTASHGFQNWLEMDKEVFGGSYKNHFGAGPKCETTITDAGKEHPILKGVKPFASEGSLYKNPDLPKDVTVLLTGTAKENTEPIAWVRERKVGDKTQRVFYTSLGHPKDFEEEAFTRMLRNAIGWCANDERLAK